jgi:hypothetical protein
MPDTTTTVTDADGRWIVRGKTRMLVEPSPAFLAKLAADQREPTAAEKRRELYPSDHDLVIALWELIVEDKIEAVESIQGVRLAIKEQFPKDEDAIPSIWDKLKSYFGVAQEKRP